MSALEMRIEDLEQASCFELVALGSKQPEGDVPRTPGTVKADSAGRAQLLHFAPGRWLVPAPEASLLATLQGAAGTSLVDVEGKWRKVVLRGPNAARVLGRTISLDSVFNGRECAAVTIFDSPAVLRRTAEGFEAWVLASYLDHFKAAVERVPAAV